MSPTRAFPQNDPDRALRPQFARGHVTSDDALDARVQRHLEHAARVFALDEELGTHHGLAWADFVLLTLLDGEDDGMAAPTLASRLGLTASGLVRQLLPLEKTGLAVRATATDGTRRVTLRPGGRRLLREARDTAAAVCAAAVD